MQNSQTESRLLVQEKPGKLMRMYAVPCIVSLLVAALLLPRWFGLNGVLYSMPASDILTFILSAVILMQTDRQLDKDIRNAVT